MARERPEADVRGSDCGAVYLDSKIDHDGPRHNSLLLVNAEDAVRPQVTDSYDHRVLRRQPCVASPAPSIYVLHIMTISTIVTIIMLVKP